MSNTEPINQEVKDTANTILLEVSKFVVTLANESERVAVVMGIAQIDITLERLLKSLFHNHPGGQDNLFDPDRPLSTFSAKIALAYRLGVIDSDFEHVLQMMRKIRNDFAHSTEIEKLSESRHRNRMKEVLNVMRSNPSFDGIKKALDSKISSPDLADFSTAIDFTLILLESIMAMNKRISLFKTASFKIFEI